MLKAASRVFKFARRRLSWHGENPVAGLENGERPKTGANARRRIFSGDELVQTLTAAHEPHKTLFALAATTGARLSECLGLVWRDVDLADSDAAAVSFAYQVDRQGRRQPLKTQESRRTVELPRSLAAMLLAQGAQPALAGGHLRLRHPHGSRARAAERTTRCTGLWSRREQTPASLRSLRSTPSIKAGRALAVERGAVPNFHAFRHTAASDAIAAGDGAEEVSWQLGHKNSNVTRAVYVQEVKSAERRARLRAKIEARYGSALEAATRSRPAEEATHSRAEVLDLQRVRVRRSRPRQTADALQAGGRVFEPRTAQSSEGPGNGWG